MAFQRDQTFKGFLMICEKLIYKWQQVQFQYDFRNDKRAIEGPVTQQYIPVLQVLVKYVFSTYLYRMYSRSTSHSSSGNTRIVISVSFTYSSLISNCVGSLRYHIQ